MGGIVCNNNLLTAMSDLDLTRRALQIVFQHLMLSDHHLTSNTTLEMLENRLPILRETIMKNEQRRMGDISEYSAVVQARFEESKVKLESNLKDIVGFIDRKEIKNLHRSLQDRTVANLLTEAVSVYRYTNNNEVSKKRLYEQIHK